MINANAKNLTKYFILINCIFMGYVCDKPPSKLELDPEEIIKFEAKDIDRSGIYNPHFWTENNERSTSSSYTLWKQADVYLIEWPGNITVHDPAWPLLKWTKSRAKFLVNHCCEYLVGIEMRAYAHKYLYLTWGTYRLTQTYSNPLTVPGNLLRGGKYSKKRTEILITDFAFVHDALLIVPQDEGSIIRVFGLEMAFARIQQTSLFPLQYALSKGISSSVNKLVTQYCCAKLESDVCPHGETVVAYQEYSSEFRIFVSLDGGENFKMLLPEIPKSSSLLHSVLSYPDTGKIQLFHGNETSATLDSYSMSNGALISDRKSAQGEIQLNGIHGMLQASRIGEEMSVIIWDQCNVWYSLAEGKNLTKAVFYIHGDIYNFNSTERKHYILPSYCKFGINSTFTTSNSGKLALLDSENVFYLGVDTKSTIFQLVALKVDMSLILPKHQLSIVPHFDRNQHPKLIYPPRYLEVPDKAMLGKNYSERLGMRLLPKTVFPSEFTTVFYEENAWLPKKFKTFALQKCQTSSISVNRSISQKSKVYAFDPLSQANFTVVFKSRKNASRQLNYEPKDVNKFLSVRMRLRSVVETEPDDAQYWFTYDVIIKAKSLISTRRTFLINFFTHKTLRCNIQPSSPVYVKINDGLNLDPALEFDMSQSFLSAPDMKTKYGKSYKQTVKSCPSGTCSKTPKPPKRSCGENIDLMSYDDPNKYGMDVHIK